MEDNYTAALKRSSLFSYKHSEVSNQRRVKKMFSWSLVLKLFYSVIYFAENIFFCF